VEASSRSAIASFPRLDRQRYSGKKKKCSEPCCHASRRVCDGPFIRGVPLFKPLRQSRLPNCMRPQDSPDCEDAGLIIGYEVFSSVLNFGMYQACVLGAAPQLVRSVQCQTLLRLCTHPRPKHRKFGRKYSSFRANI
jgi:hypothetical protein